MQARPNLASQPLHPPLRAELELVDALHAVQLPLLILQRRGNDGQRVHRQLQLLRLLQ